MPTSSPSHPNVLSVFGFALGWGVAILIVRLLLMPIVFLLNHTSNWMLMEGGSLASYLGNSVIWALTGGVASGIAAIIHNEMVKRKP